MRPFKTASRWIRMGYHMAIARVQSGMAHQYQKITIQKLDEVDKARRRVDRKMRLADAQQLERQGKNMADSAGTHWQKAQGLAYKLKAPARIQDVIQRHGIRLGKRSMAVHFAVKEWAKNEM